MSVYLGCAGSGQSEEGRDMRLHLQSDHVPWLSLVYFSEFPLCSIVAFNVDAVTAPEATTALQWQRFESLNPESLLLLPSLPT